MPRTVMMVIAWTALGLIAIATLSPIDARPELGSATMERFGAFALTGLLFGLAYPRRPWVVAVIVLAAAFVFEALQMLTPDRHGQASDAVVKCLGGAVGIGMSLVINRLSGMSRGPSRAEKPAARSNAPNL